MMDILLSATITGTNTGDVFLGVMMLFVGVGLLLAVAAGFSLFFLYAIAMTRIARNEGYERAWLAWVPILNLMLIPILTEQDIHPGLRGKFTAIYAASVVAAIAFGGFVPFVALLPMILTIYGFYFLVARYSENPIVYAVIASVTLTASIPVQLFRLRKRERLSVE